MYDCRKSHEKFRFFLWQIKVTEMRECKICYRLTDSHRMPSCQKTKCRNFSSFLYIGFSIGRINVNAFRDKFRKKFQTKTRANELSLLIWRYALSCRLTSIKLNNKLFYFFLQSFLDYSSLNCSLRSFPVTLIFKLIIIYSSNNRLVGLVNQAWQLKRKLRGYASRSNATRVIPHPFAIMSGGCN